MRNKNKSQSPVPQIKSDAAQLLSFPEAIKHLIGGKTIRRKEWADLSEYGLLKDSFLMIHRNGAFHTWIVSEGDMLAVDWMII